MSRNEPQRVERQQTDKVGYVPVYTTAVVEQPWASYAREDHRTGPSCSSVSARSSRVVPVPSSSTTSNASA